VVAAVVGGLDDPPGEVVVLVVDAGVHDGDLHAVPGQATVGPGGGIELVHGVDVGLVPELVEGG
jgi:hypothetical protein